MSPIQNISSRARTVVVAVGLVPVLFVAVAALQVRIDALSGPLAQKNEELLVRSGPMLKKLSLGYDSLLADIYWTRAVQYFGSGVQAHKMNYDLLDPLLNITVTLDPQLMIAYRFGAIFLSENPPGGAGRPDQAVDLVRRGIAANPDEWRLYQDLGFIYYTHLKDYKKASEAFLEGSRNPKALVWMRVMAARVAESGESPATSRLIWAQIYDTTRDEAVRRTALIHVQALDASMQLKSLNEISENYWRKFNRYPASIEELRSAGFLRGSLVDPAGYPYVMGPAGVPQLNPDSPIDLDSDHPKPVKPLRH
jgi:tetratricopeptide (TPR) repeat protein